MTTHRVRNHELEDVSLAALRFALPAKWVIHEYRRDYGIDVQIELFDDSGEALGLRCFGQLKATDNLEADDELSLSADHFDYWSSHSDPVLLLRYYAGSKTFRWCWMHDVAWTMKSGSRTLSVVRFLQPWTEESPRGISTFLKRRVVGLRSRLVPPVVISLRSESRQISELMQIANSAALLVDSSLFELTAGDSQDASFTISFEERQAAVSHFGLPGIVLEFEKDVPCLAPLVWLLVFLAACHYDKASVACPLAEKHAELLVQVARGPIVAHLADGLAYAIGVKKAALAMQPFREVSTTSEFLDCALVIASLFRSTHRFKQVEAWIEVLVEELRSSREKQRSAIAYTLGNAYASERRWADALQAFQISADFDPAYLRRAYFHCDLGGVFFESEDYAKAVSHYEQALELEDIARTRYLLADALFCHGQFRRANVQVALAINAGLTHGDLPHALLLKELSEELVEEWQIDLVDPSIEYCGETEVFESLRSESEEEFTKQMGRLLAQFGCSGFFHFNAGYAASLAGKKRMAAFRYLNCGVRQRGDTEAWVLGTANAMQSNNADLASLAISVSYSICGEKVVEDFLKRVLPEELSPQDRRQAEEAIVQMFRSAGHDVQKPLVLRLHGSDGTHALNIPR